MKFLIAVPAVIIFLAALILLSHFKLRIKSNGALKLTAGVGPVMITVYPRHIRKKRLSAAKYKKLMMNGKTEVTTSDEPDSKKTEKKNGITDIISFIRELLVQLGQYAEHFHTEIKKLGVTVGGDNAAEAAIKCGAVLGSVYLAAELLDEQTKLHPSSYSNISVRCDFLSDEINTECDIQMKIRIWHILRMAVKLLILRANFDSD